MKVIIFSVTPIQSGLKALNINDSFNGGGWIDSLIRYMPAKDGELELHVAFLQWGIREIRIAYDAEAGITYYALPSCTPYLNKIDSKMLTVYKRLYEQVEPDLIHIFGTETVHSNALLKLAGKDRCLISITGVITKYLYSYFGGIQQELKKIYTFRDTVKGGIFRDYTKMQENAVIEQDTLLNASNVTGRTTWDLAVTKQINKKLNYYFCNENLRDAFYETEWNVNTCEKYSIFSSSSASPLKGAHQLLMAMPLILKKFPETRLYLTGNDPRAHTFKGKLKRTGYQKYLAELIGKLNINDSIIFTGLLNEREMAKRCSESHVYVLPSNIENSPNSLCEAMLMGVPSIAADVGGVPDLLTTCVDGYLYPYDEHYMLAYRVVEIFDDDAKAVRISEEAKKRARKRHDRKENSMTMMEIYRKIIYGESADE